MAPNCTRVAMEVFSVMWKMFFNWKLNLRNLSLAYPWIAFPWLNKRFYKYPTSTLFKMSVEQLKRAYYYRLMTFTAEATYGFQTSRSWSHQLSPLSITYNKMQNTTERFDSIARRNSALYVSLRDQFIPAMQYSITYDNTWNNRIRHTMHFEGTVKESANFLNLTNALLGFDYYQKDKKLLSTPYSQFLKFNFQLKNIFHITEKTSIATRVQLGAIWTYGMWVEPTVFALSPCEASVLDVTMIPKDEAPILTRLVT